MLDVRIIKFLGLIFLIFSGVNCLATSDNRGVGIAGEKLKVFPGAKGFGTYTQAGRGGTILYVTNLRDKGHGSLREAVNAKGPRIIVFEVSGRIKLDSNLVITEPFCTIAGQTAPAPGIMVTDRTVVINTHDVLLQHVAFRVGDEGKKRDGSWDSTDAIQIIDDDSYNVVVDHISASWSIDENVSIGFGANNITVSNSIIAEPLNKSVHSKFQPHGFNLMTTKGSFKVSIFSNLIAHGQARNPYLQGCSAIFANNLVYNNGTTVPEYVSISSDEKINYPWFVNIVGNVFIDGPSSNNKYAIHEWKILNHEDSQTYYADNIYSKKIYYGQMEVKTPHEDTWPKDFTPIRSSLVESHILENAGARPAYRDLVDSRIVLDVLKGRGFIIDSQTQVGSFPVYAENKRTFFAGFNPDGDDDGDGYTNIEEILYQMALSVEGKSPRLMINILGTELGN